MVLVTWLAEERATCAAESYNGLLWNPTAFTTLTGSVLLDFHLVHGNFNIVLELRILWNRVNSTFLRDGRGCSTQGAANSLLGAILNDK